MQNTIPKLTQTTIISKKPLFLSEKMKTLTSFNYIDFDIFCWNFPYVFYLVMSTKVLKKLVFFNFYK